MRRYETIVILKPTLGEDENQAVLGRATGIIEDGGGALIKIDKWGVKTLAYLIQKEKQGYFLYIQYSGTPEAVAEMERIFRIDDRVMKYLTVKLQEVYTHMPEDDIVEESKPAADDSDVADKKKAPEDIDDDDDSDDVDE